MNVWALSDIHLGPGAGKFHYSSNWVEHQQQLRKSLDERVGVDDLLLMPGDFSWNRDPVDLKYDYLWLDERPGTKIMSPGNHDYGIWDSGEDAREFCRQFPTLNPLRDEAVRLENPYGEQYPGIVVVGVEGSQAPEDHYFNTNAGESAIGKDPESVRFLIQMLALRRALDHAQSLMQEGDQLVVMFHYPPFAWQMDNKAYLTIWTSMIEQAGATLCVYGHLHQKEQFRAAFQGNNNGVEYRFVGADFLLFYPTLLGQWTKRGLVLDAPEVTAEEMWPAPQAKNKHKNKTTQASLPKTESTDTDVYGCTVKVAQTMLKNDCTECHKPIKSKESYYENDGAVWHADQCGSNHGS